MITRSRGLAISSYIRCSELNIFLYPLQKSTKERYPAILKVAVVILKVAVVILKPAKVQYYPCQQHGSLLLSVPSSVTANW